MKNNIPPSMIKIVTILKEAGYEAYFVGGCVRDMLMQRKTHDYDITTNALPQETMQIVAAKGYQVIPTGIKHGTITVLVNKEPVEITTYRIEMCIRDSPYIVVGVALGAFIHNWIPKELITSLLGSHNPFGCLLYTSRCV